MDTYDLWFSGDVGRVKQVVSFFIPTMLILSSIGVSHIIRWVAGKLKEMYNG